MSAPARLLVLDNDAEGRSRLVRVSEIVDTAIEGVPGAAMASLFATDQSPPPPCAPGSGRSLPGGLAPGHLAWYRIDYAPSSSSGEEENAGTELHYRSAIDLVVMVQGGGDYLLADGAHSVRAGDCIVMFGTDHGFRAGAEGCRMLCFEVGTPPPT